MFYDYVNMTVGVVPQWLKSQFHDEPTYNAFIGSDFS